MKNQSNVCCPSCKCKNLTKDHQFVRGVHVCDKPNCECHHTSNQDTSLSDAVTKGWHVRDWHDTFLEAGSQLLGRDCSALISVVGGIWKEGYANGHEAASIANMVDGDTSLSKETLIEDFVEKGGALEHARWGRWHKYMLSRMSIRKDDSLEFDKEDFERWLRQSNTPYNELSEKEKESDRREVREYLPLISDLYDKAHAGGREEYEELLYAVGNKYDDETRHETALRYIRNAEKGNDSLSQSII